MSQRIESSVWGAILFTLAALAVIVWASFTYEEPDPRAGRPMEGTSTGTPVPAP